MSSRSISILSLFILGGCPAKPGANKVVDTAGLWADAYDAGREAGYSDAAAAFETRLAALEDQMGTMQPIVDEADLLLDYVSVDEADANGPAVKFTGANVYVQSGSGATDDGGVLTGLGNLIVGYDETRAESSDSASVCYSSGLLEGEDVHLPTDTLNVDIRTGSHNLIVGRYNNRRSYGGLVAGQCNEIRGVANTVAGGGGNITDGWHVAITGGIYNYATDEHTVVSGGALNWANGFGAMAGGGGKNTASGAYSSVTGGSGNSAVNEYSAVTAGLRNSATGTFSSVSGGSDNEARASRSSVAGGDINVAAEECATVSGGANNTASGYHSSVVGGSFNDATDDGATILGGSENTAAGLDSTITGGYGSTESDDYGTSP